MLLVIVFILYLGLGFVFASHLFVGFSFCSLLCILCLDVLVLGVLLHCLFYLRGCLRGPTFVEVLDGFTDSDLLRIGTKLLGELVMHFLAHVVFKGDHLGVKRGIGLLGELLVFSLAFLKINLLLLDIRVYIVNMLLAFLYTRCRVDTLGSRGITTLHALVEL